MSKCELRRVRHDHSVAVYTEHTDRIHPRDLSDSLAARVGRNRFRVSLRKNIYVIYVDARRCAHDDVSTVHGSKHSADAGMQKQVAHSDDGEEPGMCTIQPPTYQQRLEDFKMAQKILCTARLTQ